MTLFDGYFGALYQSLKEGDFLLHPLVLVSFLVFVCNMCIFKSSNAFWAWGVMLWVLRPSKMSPGKHGTPILNAFLDGGCFSTVPTRLFSELALGIYIFQAPAKQMCLG